MSSHVVRGCRAALAALVLVPALTACSGSSKTKTASVNTTAGPTTTVTTTAPSTTATTVVAGAAGKATPTTKKPTGATTTRPAGTSSAPAYPPPAAGLYRYDTAGTTTAPLTNLKYPAVTTLAVDAQSGTRQHSARNLRDGSGNGPLFDFTLDYRPQGIYVEGIKLTVGFSGVTNTQDLRPPTPQPLLPAGARPGTHLEYDVSSGTSTAHVVIDVLRTERVTIGGQGVDTLVMHVVARLPAGDATGIVDLTAWFAPSARLWVKEKFVLDASAGGFTLHSDYAATLQRLP